MNIARMRQSMGASVGQAFVQPVVPLPRVLPRFSQPLAPVYPKPLLSEPTEAVCYRFPMTTTRVASIPIRTDLLAKMWAALNEVRSKPGKWAYWADTLWRLHDYYLANGVIDASVAAEIKEVEVAIRAANPACRKVSSGLFSETVRCGSDLGLIDAIVARCTPIDTTAAPLTAPVSPPQSPSRGGIYASPGGAYIPPQGVR